MITVSIKKLQNLKDWPLPYYATQFSAGMDLTAAIEDPIVLKPMERTLVPTGIAIALPAGFEAQIRPRSGLAIKHGITLMNTPGTIDADYRGEIKVIAVNLSQDTFTVESGMRIAQMVVSRFSQVEWDITEDLSTTARSTGGFGSTGI